MAFALQHSYFTRREFCAQIHPVLLRCFALFLGVFITMLFTQLLQTNKEVINTVVDKPAQVKLLQNGKPIQTMLRPIGNIVQHTDFIGTEEQPTLDGGIINAADGLAVNTVPESVTHNSYVKAQTKMSRENYDVKSRPKTATAFQDTWATSARVKELLHQAAKDGKLEYVLNKTEEKGLPASVAVVPMVESRYQEKATSAKGAAGAWQLMSSTAKDYGVNKEDRYKLQPATEAALNLLQDLYQQFGSWELAFAAYNAGADRVQSALRKNPQAQSIQELDLPKETKAYVKQLMAINNAIEVL